MDTTLPRITKHWSTGRLWWKKKIQVDAEQVEMPPEFGGLSATAKVTIKENGVVVHEADIPWPMPKMDIMLPLQVYTLAKKPDYAHPKWQPIMEQFAFSCDGFSPPTKMWWTRQPVLD
jgi:hypothetical protein